MNSDPESFAELGVASNFSFLRGASHADELARQAAELGYSAIGIADLNTLSGVVRMHVAAKNAGIKFLVGARLAFSDCTDMLVWPSDRAAYARLCRLLTLGKRRAPKGECHLSVRDFLAHSEGIFAAVLPPESLEVDFSRQLGPIKDVLGKRLSLVAACVFDSDNTRRLEKLIAMSRAAGVPLLASNDVHYHIPARRMLQDVLTCIRHGCTIHSAGRNLFCNGERYLKSPEKMRAIFAEHPQAIARGLEIASQCNFSLDELRYEYPNELAPRGQNVGEYLAQCVWSGAAGRYPDGIPPKVRGLLEHELKLIGELKIEAYFLTVYDLVNFARGRGILCQGRGSAANSAACYCLGITSVDPSRIDVLFERFVSAARNEPPDIDVDFEHERREEVIQYLYEKYGRDRAGMTAEVITYRGRSAVRDVGKAMGLGLDMVDQLAKRLDWWDRGALTEEKLQELGLDPADRTIHLVMELTAQLLGFPRHLGQHVGGMVMTCGLLSEMVPIENAVMEDRTVIEWDKQDIDDLGILKVDVLALGMLTCISKAFRLISMGGEETKRRRDEETKWKGGEETERREYLGGSLSPSPGTPGEGGGEGRLKLKSFQAANDFSCPHPRGHTPACPLPEYRERGRRVPPPKLNATPLLLELHTVPAEDPVVYEMISDADTVGVFQIESRAQMSMLPRLRPREFYDLVIEVAIVRPGPIQGDMVHPYLRRRNGEEPVTYPSEALRQVLQKTLGVPLFQEQAMRVAMVGAGFSAGEADQLRRAMAAWRKSGALENFEKKIVEGMLRNGYTLEYAHQCFNMLKGFGEYGFPESHSASFALLVYVSSWIKRYHPAAFCCALLNSQPMGFYAPAQLVRDAMMHGVTVLAVDVNHSDWDCTLGERRDEGMGERDEETKRRRDEVGDGGKELGGRDEVKRREEDGPTEESAFSSTSSLSPLVPVKWDWGRDGPTVRLGFRQVRGISEIHAKQITAARAGKKFVSMKHFVQSSRLPAHVLRKLAQADAFSSLGLSRRQAMWEVMRCQDDDIPLFEEDHAADEPLVELPKMPIGREVLTDYHMAGLSLKRHPVALLRKELTKMGITPSGDLAKVGNGQWVSVAGIVLIRQRPGTASGIVFETLEDETGVANLIIRPMIYEKYRNAARHASLVRADGYVEKQGQVIHVMALRLTDLSDMVREGVFRSRDFR